MKSNFDRVKLPKKLVCRCGHVEDVMEDFYVSMIEEFYSPAADVACSPECYVSLYPEEVRKDELEYAADNGRYSPVDVYGISGLL